MPRSWLLSTVSLLALMPYLKPHGKFALADFHVHQWVKAELKRLRAAESIA